MMKMRNEKKEIMNKNSFALNEIDTIMKFPKSRTLKTTLKKTQIAKKATEQGLLMFAMRTPEYQVKQEKFP